MSAFEVLIPISIIGFTALMIKIISDTIIRSKIIKKGMVDENLRYLYNKKPLFQHITNLKWGFILIGIGIPFLLRQLFPDLFTDEGTIGLMFILAGVGFILYYNIAKNESQQNEVNE